MSKITGYKHKLTNSKGDVEVEVSVSNDLYKSFLDKAYGELKDTVKLSGFRAGKAPRPMVEKKWELI